MFQKFYTDTLGGRFIKSLLAQTPIPLFDCVVDGDHLIEGCYYVYKRYIIKCASSGILSVDTSDNLYPSDKLFPSVFLFAGKGYKAATFYVKDFVDNVTPQTHSVFKSPTNYYDSETHYQLSRYLRFVQTTTGLDLFPFYNFYGDKHLTDIELSVTDNGKVSCRRSSRSRYKVVAVPVRYGKTYSIYIDCPTQVLMRACVYDDSGFVDESTILRNGKASDKLDASGTVFSHMQFSSAQKFRFEIDSIEWMKHQSNFYLVIQLPKDNDSSIVVLENYENSLGIRCDSNYVRIPPKTSSLNLLRLNTRESYAFSDRLIEYLLGNVIHPSEQIAKNISNVQNALSKNYDHYARSFINGKNKKGVWNNDIPRLVFDICENSVNSTNLYDQDGNINRDTETLLYSKGGYSL